MIDLDELENHVRKYGSVADNMAPYLTMTAVLEVIARCREAEFRLEGLDK